MALLVEGRDLAAQHTRADFQSRDLAQRLGLPDGDARDLRSEFRRAVLELGDAVRLSRTL